MESIEKGGTQKPVRLILVGFMGAGKTSLGKGCAKKLGIPLLDTDELIVRRECMPISRIFAEKGEPYFRRIETETVRELTERDDPFVLSVGGGLALREENRVLLRQLGTVVYLKTGVDTLEERLRGDTKRPLLRQGEGTLREKIERILSEREPKYLDAADVVVENEGKSFYAVVRELCALAG